MTWLLWRQHRRQTAFAGVLFGLFALLLLTVGHSTASTSNGSSPVAILVDLTIAVPLLVGIFWGVTAVGRELETGTHLLVWTQSVTTREWLRGKIALLLLSAAVWGAASATLVTWWSKTRNSLELNRFDPGKFDIQGIVPVAYAIFAVSLGLAAGAFLRRLLPAIGATLGLFIAVRLTVISYVRPHFGSPRVFSGGLSFNPPSGSWVFSRSIEVGGKTLNGPFDPAQNCPKTTRAAMDHCLEQGGIRSVTKYEPASHYWNFQWIESGLFLALAAVLIAATVIVVRRRDA
jgi:hypothetical protein